ncbi:MAG: aminopeptidase [Kiritimatiellae bacterium]|nr:aminopeptidase [Kiritimatiellia bacterium]
MQDQRVTNLARVLVRYSVAAKSKQHIAVDATAEAEPLVVAVYEELLRAGAYPVVRTSPASLGEIFYRLGKPHHFDKVTAYQRAMVQYMDASIRISSSPNTRALSGTDPRKMARVSKASRPLREILLKKPWVLTLYPTQGYAQDAEMSLAQFEDFVFHATFADAKDPVARWKELARRQARLIARLRGADQVRIVGADTDLTLSVKRRIFINSAGRHNMPCGEIFTGPVESSASGYIRYDYPVCHAGREIDGIRLVFRHGRVVEATAEKNEKFLHAMLDMDPGARRLGELGIGTNYNIQRFIKNILFDEKIGGSVHLALGNSYEETGGRNKSALHWDMIKDLRRGGALYVDGKVVQKDGKFRI